MYSRNNQLVKIFVFSLIILPMMAYCQPENKYPSITDSGGVFFRQELNWQQVLVKAKAENKNIFIDCYTTWCGPCKEMEKSVYPLEKVGEFFNDKMISVKMQMDSAKDDDESIKRHYADAHYIRDQYKIDAYPTFLFFTPDGRILDRSTGAKTSDDFLALAADALDPSKNYYKRLELFRQGERNSLDMIFLARMGLKLGDSATAQRIAKEYIFQFKSKALLDKDNIEFMQEFTKSSRDNGFKWFYRCADSVDKIMGDDTYARQFVQNIIYKEIVVAELDKVKSTPGTLPNWGAIQSIIRGKYNEYYSDRVIVAAKTAWALNHKNWPEYTKHLVLFQEKFGSKLNHDLMASFSLNNYAWTIFLYSNNKEELKKALSWSSRAVMMYPTANWMDTYANILYKLGRDKESTMWEEIAGRLSPNDKEIQEGLEKMKKGEPTWNGR